MVAIFFGVYFLLACALIWLTLFPEGRAYFHLSVRRATRFWSVFLGSSSTAADKTRTKATAVSRYFTGWLQNLGQIVAKHKWSVLVAAALFSVPPTAIMMFGSGSYSGGFNDNTAVINPQVASLLKGEQLVPPAPLPPEVFIAADALMLRNQLSQYTVPLLASASRNWQLLDPEYAQRLLLVFKIMREQHGYEMAILEGYRSPERQDMLSKLGVHVTGAKAFQSYHQYGLAADCAFLREGQLVISEKDPWAMKGYTLYGEVAESVGLTWGGRWKIMDFGHVEWRKPGFVKKAPAQS